MPQTQSLPAVLRVTFRAFAQWQALLGGFTNRDTFILMDEAPGSCSHDSTLQMGKLRLSPSWRALAIGASSEDTEFALTHLLNVPNCPLSLLLFHPVPIYPSKLRKLVQHHLPPPRLVNAPHPHHSSETPPLSLSFPTTRASPGRSKVPLCPLPSSGHTVGRCLAITS